MHVGGRVNAQQIVWRSERSFAEIESPIGVQEFANRAVFGDGKAVSVRQRKLDVIAVEKRKQRT